MPDYAKQLWVDNDATKALSAARMNYLEAGVAGSVQKTGGSIITADAATVTPLVVKGAASQSANLLEARNDAGAVLARVTSDGTIATAVGRLALALDTGAQASLSTQVAGRTGLVVRGVASQTASLAEFQLSGGASVVTIDAHDDPAKPVARMILNCSVIGSRRVEVGPVDSAGAGFRALRVAN